MAGLCAGSDPRVVRGDMASPAFCLFHYGAAGRLTAADSVNASKAPLLVRKLMDAGVSPTPQQAGDAAFDPGSLLPK